MTLRNAGVEPVVVPSEVDEEAILASTSLAPRDTVQLLARAKAEAVVSRDAATVDGVILGGDSMFEFDGEVYGKPHHPEVALERWKRMRGRRGTLHSGHW